MRWSKGICWISSLSSNTSPRLRRNRSFRHSYVTPSITLLCLREGDEAHCVYMIMSGVVELVKHRCVRDPPTAPLVPPCLNLFLLTILKNRESLDGKLLHVCRNNRVTTGTSKGLRPVRVRPPSESDGDGGLGRMATSYNFSEDGSMSLDIDESFALEVGIRTRMTDALPVHGLISFSCPTRCQVGGFAPDSQNVQNGKVHLSRDKAKQLRER